MIVNDLLSKTIATKDISQKNIDSALNTIKTYNPQKNSQELSSLLQNIGTLINGKNIKDLNKLLSAANSALKNFPQDTDLKNIKNEIEKSLQNKISSQDEQVIEKSEIDDKIDKIINLSKKLSSQSKKNSLKTLKAMQKELGGLKNLIDDEIEQYKTNFKSKNRLSNEVKLLNIKKNILQIQSIITKIGSNSPLKLQSLQDSINKINALLEEIQNNKLSNSSPKTLEQIIKNSILSSKTSKITFFGNKKTVKHIGNITSNLNAITKSLSNHPKLQKYTDIINKFTSNLENIELKDNIKNSGILYESKIAQNIHDKEALQKNTQQDLKAVLLDLKSRNEIQNNPSLSNLIDKTITQIQSYQASSLINSTFTSYIPFLWDDLKEGSMQFGKLNNEEGFSCKIELDLNDYGEVDILMLLNQNSISIKMDASNNDLKNKIRENLRDLRVRLNSISLNANIYLTNISKTAINYDNTAINSTNLSLDIKT
ncbi:MAG: hypothetical protein GXO12_04795 [Epsilonproteobacteria bacterium]|nr:hypothetical protein [Campylobacterota bacterium]